jgi:hypothetical protein
MKPGECLQAGDVGSEGEPAVAHAKRGQRIGFAQRDIMPAYKCATVYSMYRWDARLFDY